MDTDAQGDAIPRTRVHTRTPTDWLPRLGPGEPEGQNPGMQALSKPPAPGLAARRPAGPGADGEAKAGAVQPLTCVFLPLLLGRVTLEDPFPQLSGPWTFV